LGSIVQKGKLAAWAFALLKQLNNVDFPTLGSPTIPHCNPMIFRYLYIYFLPYYNLQIYSFFITYKSIIAIIKILILQPSITHGSKHLLTPPTQATNKQHFLEVA
jgi:hypothetical protein